MEARAMEATPKRLRTRGAALHNQPTGRSHSTESATPPKTEHPL